MIDGDDIDEELVVTPEEERQAKRKVTCWYPVKWYGHEQPLVEGEPYNPPMDMKTEWDEDSTCPTEYTLELPTRNPQFPMETETLSITLHSDQEIAYDQLTYVYEVYCLWAYVIRRPKLTEAAIQLIDQCLSRMEEEYGVSGDLRWPACQMLNIWGRRYFSFSLYRYRPHLQYLFENYPAAPECPDRKQGYMNPWGYNIFTNKRYVPPPPPPKKVVVKVLKKQRPTD